MIKVFNNEEHENCNIQFQFNDYTLSVFIGKGSYSKTTSNALNLIESENVEIAILNDEGDFILPEQVLGHQSIDALSRVMSVMRNKHNEQKHLVHNILLAVD